MKRPGSTFYYIVIFVIAQIAWFSLLGIWIYWYVTNYLLYSEIGESIPPQIIPGTANIWALVSGILLLVLLSVSMSLIFIYLNRQLHLNRLYDTFIANVTHELKSPITAIQLYLETMGKYDVPKRRQKQFLALMLKDIDRLEHLINSILYLSSMEQKRASKKVAHDYHIYNADLILREVAKEVFSELKVENEYYRIEGKLDCQCVVDRYWLKIVFSNLIDNALKYSFDRPQIKIVLCQRLKYFHIDLVDNGIGIEKKDQKKVFNKFERIYHPNSPNVKGTGLGLYWVKQIVEYHGGKIGLESKGRGFGSTFKIALPVYRASKKRYVNRLLRLSKKDHTPEGTLNEQ